MENSELNLDISDWITNLLFNCKYAEPVDPSQSDLAEMPTVCDNQFFYDNRFEESKVETPSFMPKHLEPPKLQKIYSFGDVYDINSNLSTNYTQASALNLPEVKLSKFQSFGLSGPSTKSTYSFDETRGSTPKTPLIMDLEIENLE